MVTHSQHLPLCYGIRDLVEFCDFGFFQNFHSIELALVVARFFADEDNLAIGALAEDRNHLKGLLGYYTFFHFHSEFLNGLNIEFEY